MAFCLITGIPPSEARLLSQREWNAAQDLAEEIANKKGAR